MKHKLIAFTISAVMLSGLHVMAADTVLSENSRQITVTETVTPETEAILMVIKAGEEIDNDDALYAMLTAVSDSEGKIKWEFSMPDVRNDLSTDGEYDLYIKVDGKDILKDKMIYATVSNRNRVTDAFKNVTSAKELKDIIDSSQNSVVLKSMGIDIDKYKDSDNDKVLKFAFEEIGNFQAGDTEKIIEEINTAIVAVGINKENAEEYLNTANFVYEGKAFSDIDNEKLSKWLCDIVGNDEYSSSADFKKAYQTVNVLYVINNTRVQNIEKVLKEYSKTLGITNEPEYKDYINLTNKTKADKAIVKNLTNSPAEDINDLLNAIDDGVEAAETKSSGGGSGGGGGGGSSPSGTGTSPYVAVDKSPAEEPAVNKKFFDMSDASWAEKAVNALAGEGIINGDENGNFRPNDIMTREEFTKMLVLVTGSYNPDAECDFADTNKNAWHYSYIASAFNKGIAKGISDELFGTGESLTRQDMAVLCRRCAGELKSLKDADTFADDNSISDYAKNSVYELYRAGVINGMGDGSFCPSDFATRAQGAMIIYNLFLK